jgi:hypothetical protein
MSRTDTPCERLHSASFQARLLFWLIDARDTFFMFSIELADDCTVLTKPFAVRTRRVLATTPKLSFPAGAACRKLIANALWSIAVRTNGQIIPGG